MPRHGQRATRQPAVDVGLAAERHYVLGNDLLRSPFETETPAPPSIDTLLRHGALVLLAFTLTWSAVEYLRHRTVGVSGSDPFCYVQRAVDFAQHGTFAHRFPLAVQATAWGLPPGQTLPVGYWLPGGPDAAITGAPRLSEPGR